MNGGKWCPRCEEDRRGVFCWRCGSRLTEKPEMKTRCPRCGVKVNPSYMSYCPECGGPLRSWVGRHSELVGYLLAVLLGTAIAIILRIFF